MFITYKLLTKIYSRQVPEKYMFLRVDRKIKKKNATNNIKSIKKILKKVKSNKYINIQLYLLKRDTHKIILYQWTYKFFTRKSKINRCI